MNIEWTPEKIYKKYQEYIDQDTDLKKTFSINKSLSGIFKTITNAISRMFCYIISDLILNVYRNIFVSTADQEGLILHLRDKGMTPWKQAEKAIGTIRIGCQNKPQARIEIPLMQIIQTADESKQYITLNSGFIDEQTILDDNNFYTVELPIESMETGGRYNVPAYTISKLDQSISGIDVIYNPVDTAFGRDLETIDEVRSRIVDKNLSYTEKTKTWFVSQTKENFAFVIDAICIPRFAGRGTIGIAIRTAEGNATSEQLSLVESYFNSDERDPAGGWKVYATQMTTFVWNATIRIYYDNEIPTDEELLTPIKDYFSSLGRGENIIPAWISTSILSKVHTLRNVEIINSNGFIVADEAYPILGTIIWEKQKYVEQI